MFGSQYNKPTHNIECHRGTTHTLSSIPKYPANEQTQKKSLHKLYKLSITYTETLTLQIHIFLKV